MKRLTLAVCAGLLAVAVAAPSLAADLPRPAYKAPIYTAPAFSWSGFYVGVNGGYGWGRSNWTNAVGTTGDFTVKGWLAGGTLGYNLQTGSFVWGIEGDIDYSAIKGTTTVAIPGCGAPGCETRNTWLGTIRGRLGYAWDRWMVFATGGGAFGGVKMTPAGLGSETSNKFGWTLGAGIEYAFMGSWSAKLEYLYADLGTATCSAATCPLSTDVKFRTNLIRAGLNYRF
jgi:outer membrane immunogenic protein